VDEKKPLFDEYGLRRRRPRKSESGFDKEKIAQRVCEFAKNDQRESSYDSEARLQRYAKFRMWAEDGGDFPWAGSSNIALPDMMTNVLMMEDTLHNSLMSNRPFTTARALTPPLNTSKEELIDDLLDTQVFVEQDGEKAVEDSASSFVMDGNFVAYIPWVKEDRKTVLYRTFRGFEERELPRQHLEKIIIQEFPNTDQYMIDEEGWDWEIDDGKQKFRVKFYTTSDDEIEMLATRQTRVYEGPKIIIKDYEDVLAPVRSANLQIPGPSNPNGATHVIMKDYPTIDEIQRLADSDFYDLISKKDLKKILNVKENKTDEKEKLQKDVLQGKYDEQRSVDDTHRTLTRYTCFDLYDVDGDGINTDMIWWVLKEPEILLKAKPLTEMYPSDPPRRPFAEASFIPVQGRREGIGMLEMMESLHDFKKQTFDQAVDSGTLGNTPFYFYRPTSNIKPEMMRLFPGDGVPLGDPKNDVYFPDIGSSNSQSYALNMLSMADQMQEKLTVIGDLQFGRVPVGRSSALRTSQNLQSFLQEGEARPERILRRFLSGWLEVYKQIHELNQHFLPEKKAFRIIGIRDPSDDPYREVDVFTDLQGRFDFDFSANVLNASKIAQQEVLEQAMATFISEIPLQLGIVTPDGIYRLMRDWGRTKGMRPEKYINKPSPEAMTAPVLAEEALMQIINGQMPKGAPMEGAQQHLDKLQQFAKSEMIGYLDHPNKVEILRAYMKQTAERIKMDQLSKQAGEIGAAQRGGRGQGGGEQGGGEPLDMSNPPVNDNELLDETLPTAGGGANGGMQ